MSDRFYRNYMEPLVEKAVDQFVGNDREICACDNCWSDMVASALNKLKPCYVTGTTGLNHALRRKEELAFALEVIGAVKAASELVRKSPRHDPSKRLQNLPAGATKAREKTAHTKTDGPSKTQKQSTAAAPDEKAGSEDSGQKGRGRPTKTYRAV